MTEPVVRDATPTSEREAVLALALRSVGAGVSTLDLATGLGETSAEWREVIGLPPPPAPQSLEAFLALVHPEDRKRVAALHANISGPGLDFEFRVLHPERGERWILSRSTLVPGDKGGPGRLVGVALDITERRLAEERARAGEERQAFLLGLSDALRPLADPAEIRLTAAQVLGRHLGASRVAYAEGVEGDEFYDLTPNYVDGSADIVGRFRYADYGPDIRSGLESGQPRVQPDIRNDGRLSDVQRRGLAEAGVGASLNVPLVKDGRLVAFLGVNYPTAHDFDADEIELVTEVAERTWAAVERARVEAALAASEEKYRSLFDAIDEGFVEMEMVMGDAGQVVDWRWLAFNPSFERMSGLKGIKGRLFSEIVPHPEPEWAERYGHVVATGEPLRFELPVSGLDRWFDVFVSRIGDEGSRRLAVVFNNITARKHAEEALRTSEARLAAALESVPVGIAVMDTTGTAVLANEGYRRFLPSGVIPSRDPPRTARWRAWDAQGRPIPPREFPGARALRGERVMPGLEMLYTADDGREVWTNVVSVPIRDAAGRITGGATVISDIDAARRSAEALRESEERQAFLLKLSDALRPLTDPIEITAQATRILGEYMEADRTFIAMMEPDGVNLDVHHEYLRPGASSVIGHHNFDSFGTFVSPRLVEGHVMAVEDVATLDLTAAERVHYATVGIAAYLLVPLVRDGRFAACFTCNHRTARRWSEAEKNIVRQTADSTWAAVERARAEAALREREAELARVQRIGRVGGMAVELGSPIRNHRSPEYLRLHGLPPEAAGESHEAWVARVHPEDRERVERHFIDAVAGRVRDYEAAYRIVRPSDGAVRHIEAKAEIERDAAGRALRLVGAHADVTEREVAQAELREREELFRSFADNSADTLWIVSVATGQLEYLSPAFEAMWGESRERVMGDLGHWAALVHPDDRERAAGGLPRLLAGESYQQTYRIVHPSDRAIRYIQDTGFPIRDGHGRIRRVAGIAQDVTGQVKAQRHIARSERRLRALVEGIPQLVWRAVDGGQWTWASPQWTAYTGLSEAQSRDRGWLAALYPDDAAAAMAAWAEAAEAGTLAVEYRVRHAAEDRYRWFSTRATPVRDEGGAIVEWLGTCTDIDDLRRLQEHQALLLAELQHRVRNTLAVVRSIARRTERTSETVDDYAMHLEGRLDAFGRVQAAVTRDPAGGVDLMLLVAEELRAHAAREGDQASIAGPALRLQPAAAQTFALAVHELATNAVKHGALGLPDGRVRVSWQVTGTDGDQRLAFAWRESGGPKPAPPPRRRGFGTELLERTLAYELRATVRQDFAPSGLSCSITLPLDERVVVRPS